MERPDAADLMATIATELLSEPSEVVTTQAIVDRAVEIVEGADHASLTVRARRNHSTKASTSRLAAAVDAAQHDLGEGPCVDSAEAGEWYRSGDIANDRRWPRWGPVAAEQGVQSLLSVQLLTRGETFGALNLYSEQPGRFADNEVVELAQLYTVHAANALVSAQLVTGLETALSSRHDIGVAQGILMARYGLTADQAFAALRRVSQHRNVKLRDVALDVQRTGELQEPPGTA